MVALIAAAVVVIAALGRTASAKADDDEGEKPITSTATRLSHDAAGHVFIGIRPAAQKEIGITTKILKPSVRPIEIEAYGFILDPAPLLKLNSDLLSAQAALDAASAQYRRTRRLYAEQKNASLRDLQTAQASHLTDKSQLEALEQQLRNDWGEEIARMDSGDRSQLVGALVDRREAVARVTAPVGDQPDDVPDAAEIFVLGHEEQPLKARAVYAAPMTVPTLQGQAFLVLIGRTQFPLRPGTAVSARIPISKTSQQGVMVPRSAVVRYVGNEWVYCALERDRFVRLRIVPAEITDRGYFVTQNLAPGTRIVVGGAQTLLSEELKAQIQVQD
jgi:D-alanyl-D-alanine carboxypeptidase